MRHHAGLDSSPAHCVVRDILAGADGQRLGYQGRLPAQPLPSSRLRSNDGIAREIIARGQEPWLWARYGTVRESDREMPWEGEFTAGPRLVCS